MKSKKLKLVAALLFIGGAAFGYDCDTDCGRAAQFRYPCPTPTNPGRKCTGKNPAKYVACETDKAASCRLWEEAASFFEPVVKPHLVHRFNASTYDPNHHQEYVVECTAAAVAVLAAVGSTYGPPWGTLAGGAAGFFVGKRICIQSTKW